MQLNAIIILSVLAVCSYLFGNINFALLLSKFKKKDIRNMGSGNPGTMNMLRNFGPKIGAITFVLDILKGVIPAFAANIIFSDVNLNGGVPIYINIAVYTVGLCAIIGHIFPVFLKFKGGKGIATTLGVFFVTDQTLTLIAFAVSLIYIILFEYGSVGNLIMITIMCCVEGYKYNASMPADINLFIICLLLLFICFITWFAHRGNLYRLMMGKEHKTRFIDILKPKIRKKKSNFDKHSGND